ncbi:MAG: LysM peptidoglycan-binding domain-containing protein [Deltaproteobacteria bacterium]|nr:LysM peptidoglycan-binding domain-containing protein [Deltaproteobacteria bacterium]
MKRTILICLMVGTLLLAFTQTPHVRAQEATPYGQADQETYIHVVVKGDTLWDICEDLYANPWVWPKVWQMNPHITNPHWIYPGTELRVYYEVARFFEEGTAVEETAVVEEAPVVEEVTPPPPPPPPKVPTITFSEIDQVGFITPYVPEGMGVILGGKRQRTLIGAADKIYVQFREGVQPEVGDRFFVFKTSLLFKHPITKKDVGYLNTMLGILEVVLVAPDHAKAVVLSSFQEMTATDKLMPYKKRSEEIAVQPGAEPIEGNIILAEWGTFLIAHRQIAFIDLGANDEIKAGHRFEVFQEPKALTSRDEEIVLSIQPIGELLVLAVEQETAATLVVESLAEFTPGERVRLITGE